MTVRRPRLVRSRMLLRRDGRRKCALYLVTACITCGWSAIEPPPDDEDDPETLGLVLVPEHTQEACDAHRRARDAEPPDYARMQA